MIATITDPVLLAQLLAATEPVEFVGPDGGFIGTFYPAERNGAKTGGGGK